jgi:hypothetical protein
MKMDLIDRQAAIDTINALHDLPNAWLDCAVDAVMALPSAQPEHKTGRWIVVDADIAENTDICECSLCRGRIWKYKNVEDMWNYCPRCGADMRGEQDVEDK